jgi:hypothetical protein
LVFLKVSNRGCFFSLPCFVSTGTSIFNPLEPASLSGRSFLLIHVCFTSLPSYWGSFSFVSSDNSEIVSYPGKFQKRSAETINSPPGVVFRGPAPGAVSKHLYRCNRFSAIFARDPPPRPRPTRGVIQSAKLLPLSGRTSYLTPLPGGPALAENRL